MQRQLVTFYAHRITIFRQFAKCDDFGKYFLVAFVVSNSFYFFEKTPYCCRARRLSVRPSVRRAVRPSVEIISFCGISISNRPIDLKMSMNVRKGVVHVRKA